MTFAHLQEPELLAVRDAILDTLGYAASTRQVLLGGMGVRYASGLPGVNGTLISNATLDLRALNRQPRLTDGSVPLKIFLRNALDIGGEAQTLDPVRLALAQIDVNTTGAQRVDVAELPETKEKILFRDEMVKWSFMSEGVRAARAVAKLQVTRFEGGTPAAAGGDPVVYLGTGWLIGSQYLLTNHHVLNARNDGEPAPSDDDLRLQTRSTTATFDFDGEGVQGVQKKLGELVAWSSALDYAIARIDIHDRLPLVVRADEIPPSIRPPATALNIIQHPEGQPKRFAIRNNLLTSVTATDIRYFTDTLGGSSGSPVCDDQWRAVALHRGSAAVSGVSYLGKAVAFVNVGTKMHAILQDLRARYAELMPHLAIGGL